MSDITPGSILDRVVQELPNFFKDGVDQLVTGEGEYIRAGEPRGTVGKIGQAVARSYCRQYGADPSAAKFGNAARIENACRPYLDDQDPGKGAQVRVPFPGGQCATLYTLTYEYNTILTNGTLKEPKDIRTATVLGPFSNLRGEGLPEFQSIRVTIGNGASAQLRSGSCPQGCFANIAFVSAVRQDGLPDNCGDTPPVVTQPRPVPDPSPPPFRFNPDGGVNVNVDATVNANGTVNVGIGGPTVNVDPFPPEGGGDGGGPTGPSPGDIGSAGGSADTGAGGEAEGEAPAGEVLVGLKVDILASPPKARQFATGVFRGAGYIYMGVIGNLDQDYGGSMLKSGQFFFAEKDNLTHWQVSANNGFNWRVTPYYREAKE
jgi:hypothetical protein